MPKLAAMALAGALVGAAAPAPPAAKSGPFPVPPGAAQTRLGGLRVIALKDAGFSSPNDGKDFGQDVGPAKVAQVLKAAGLPTDHIELAVDALALEAPHGRVILLDTGLGPRFRGELGESLKIAGIKPDEISDILITHSHFDHIGGLFTADLKPAFPKARIWFSAKEWAFLKSSKRGAKLATAIAPQVRTFEPGTPVLPGITPVALYGHTPGHVGFQIVSRGARMIDVGDIVHSSFLSVAYPQWLFGFDEDPKAGRTTRLAELARLAGSHELIFAPHFPFPGLGWIVRAGSAYRWVPDREVKAIGGRYPLIPRSRLGQPIRTSSPLGPLRANSYMPQARSEGPPAPSISPSNSLARPSTSSR
ncbi:MAG: MBL fold metallo-hydrolase [Caulobacteraceae bacterium]